MPEDAEEAVRADLDALIAETRANAGETRIPALGTIAAACCPIPVNPAFAAAAQLALDRRALHDDAAHAAALGEALGMPAVSEPVAFGFGGDGPTRRRLPGARSPVRERRHAGRRGPRRGRRCGDAHTGAPRLEALLYRPTDGASLRRLAQRDDEETAPDSSEAVKELRDRLHGHVLAAPAIRDGRRRNEIVAAWDGRWAEIADDEERSGYTAAEAEADDADAAILNGAQECEPAGF